MTDDDYPELVDWREADSRGRVSLGPEFSNQRVKIAVVEVESESADGETKIETETGTQTDVTEE